MQHRSLIIIVSSAIMLAGMNVYAQNRGFDYVYLKNGSIIKGQILDLVPTLSVKIETADGSIYVYDMPEVKKLVFASERTDHQRQMEAPSGTSNHQSPKEQTGQGNLTVGGGLQYQQTFSGGSSTRQIDMVPSIGWFAADNFLIGLDVSYQGQSFDYNFSYTDPFSGDIISASYRQWNWQLGIGPAFEFYFGPSIDKPFLRLSYLFSASQNVPSQSLTLGFGYNIHLSRDVAFQPLIQYQFLIPRGESFGETGELTVGVGLRDFIF